MFRNFSDVAWAKNIFEEFCVFSDAMQNDGNCDASHVEKGFVPFYCSLSLVMRNSRHHHHGPTRCERVHFGTSAKERIYIYKTGCHSNKRTNIHPRGRTTLAHSIRWIVFMRSTHSLSFSLSRLFVLPGAFCTHINATASVHTRRRRLRGKREKVRCVSVENEIFAGGWGKKVGVCE